MKKEAFYRDVFLTLGAEEELLEELLAYNANHFAVSADFLKQKHVVSDELFVAAWKEYEMLAKERGAFSVIQTELFQLLFPVRNGISRTQMYQDVVVRGNIPGSPIEPGLVLHRPELLQLVIQPTLAGCIPLLVTSCREDFVLLTQALAFNNEPYPIPESMGACTVSGYKNWGKISGSLRKREVQPDGSVAGDWLMDLGTFGGFNPADNAKDCFVILSYGPYSNIRSEDLGLSAEEWRQKSFIIRREHECAHYFTRRFFRSMRNHMLDELVADYIGITAAAGQYRADWFLRFMGLENFPELRPTGRIHIYRGNPPLTDAAFNILAFAITRIAAHLECFDRLRGHMHRHDSGRLRLITGLCRLTLAELASSQWEFLLERAIGR